MSSPSSAESARVERRKHARILRTSLAAVASKGRVASPAPSSTPSAPAVDLGPVLCSGLRRPSGEGRLWPGEATLLAATVLWLLVLLYVGIGEWRRMVNECRTDVGEIGER
jgi:hypothetical protein